MTDLELEAIAARAEAATAGPWEVRDADAHMVRGPRDVVLYAYNAFDGHKQGNANAAFAAAARTDVPALVEEVRKLRGVLRECEWGGEHPRWGCDVCPCCGGFGPARPGQERPAVLGGHAPYCRLAAALGVTTPRSPG